MKVGTPLEARCFLMSRSVPYQLKPLVEWPMRGRCTLAAKHNSDHSVNVPTFKCFSYTVKVLMQAFPALYGCNTQWND